jgi:hypothetical protein
MKLELYWAQHSAMPVVEWYFRILQPAHTLLLITDVSIQEDGFMQGM